MRRVDSRNVRKMNSVSQWLSGPTVLVTYYIREFSDPTQDLQSQDSGVDPVMCCNKTLVHAKEECASMAKGLEPRITQPGGCSESTAYCRLEQSCPPSLGLHFPI